MPINQTHATFFIFIFPIELFYILMTSRYLDPNDDDDDLVHSLDRQTNAQSPPLDRLSSHSPLLVPSSSSSLQHPYLIALLTCPDMSAYLAKTELPEDVWPLPLATLLSEAKAEAAAGDALQRLVWLRDYVWEAAAHDVGAMGSVLDALLKNEDQLGNILGTQESTNKHKSCIGEG